MIRFVKGMLYIFCPLTRENLFAMISHGHFPEMMLELSPFQIFNMNNFMISSLYKKVIKPRFCSQNEQELR
jgi:hypothetical protein